MMDDQSLLKALDEFEDDLTLAETADALEKELNYQEQIGGSPLATEPGCFLFTLSPYVDRRSERTGVREQHYAANLRQQSQFIEHQRLNQALSDAVHTSLRQLITNEQIPG